MVRGIAVGSIGGIILSSKLPLSIGGRLIHIGVLIIDVGHVHVGRHMRISRIRH